jgi:hypothetical protein
MSLVERVIDQLNNGMHEVAFPTIKMSNYGSTMFFDVNYDGKARRFQNTWSITFDRDPILQLFKVVRLNVLTKEGSIDVPLTKQEKKDLWKAGLVAFAREQRRFLARQAEAKR